MVKGFDRSASFFVQRYKKIGQFDKHTTQYLFHTAACLSE